MKRVELIKDCNVRLPKGTTLTVSDEEARRLVIFNLAVAKTAARKKKAAGTEED